MEIVAQRLRELRSKVDLSQMKMSEALGIKIGAVNRYKNNQSKPSCETLLKYHLIISMAEQLIQKVQSLNIR